MCSHVMRAGLLVWLTGLLIACSGEVDKVDTFALEGRVGTVSLADAEISVTDAAGEEVVTTTSDTAARYEADVPVDVELPISVVAAGGTDLITGRGADFQLSALAFSAADQHVHVSPISTLVRQLVACTGTNTPEMFDAAVDLFRNRLSMGLDPAIDALRDPFTAQNAAALVLANEALRETLRRTEHALAATSLPLAAGDVLAEVACDLGMDGQRTADGVSARALVTFRAAETAVLFEVLAKQLQIEGADGNAQMDAAVDAVFGSSASIASVAPNQALLDQAESGLVTYLSDFDDEIFVELALATQGGPEMASAEVAALLDARGQLGLAGLAERVALADESTIDALTVRMAEQPAALPPTISLAASASMVVVGESVTLSWAVDGADACVAGGGWDGPRAVQGTFQTPALLENTSFVLECAGVGGTGRRVAQIVVDAQPPGVTTSLSAAPASVDYGNAAVLSWSADNATSCVAQGAWFGPRSASGSESTGALTAPQTYRLTCEGEGGSDSAAVTVQVGAPPSPAPTIVFSADPAVVIAGGPTSLSWTASNADSCQASGGWAGSRPTAGTYTVAAVNANTTFTLSCTGPGGSASENVQVTVNIPPNPTVSLAAADTTVSRGEATTLSWNSSDATSCTASGAWSGGRAPAGSESTGALTAPGTFSLRCDGPGGSASASVVVDVRPEVSLTADPTTVIQGESATLSWDASNADGCTASGGWSGAKSASGSETLGPLNASNVFTLTCTGPGGAGSDTAQITVDAPDAPTLTLDASVSVANEGESVTLTWSTSNATACTASGGWTGTRPTSGSASVGPLSRNESFGLSCTGPGGSIQSSVPVNLRPVVDLSADATNVLQGEDVRLSWTARHADACAASGGWSGSFETSGSHTVSGLSADTSFTLTCSGPGGSASDGVAVSVEIPPVPGVVLTVADDVVDPGGATLLTWTSSDATSCTASGGWSGSKGVSGNQSTGPLADPATFTLSCDGPGGNASTSVVVNIRPAVDLSADRTTVLPGEDVVLAWTANHVSACAASGGWSGTRAASGSETIGGLSADTGFTLTCSGPGGSASGSIAISVETPPEPTVSLTVTDDVVSPGGSSMLAWTSNQATSCSASGAWSGSKATSGSESTGPLTDPGTFTLRCDGPGGSAVSMVTVNVRPTVTLSADRTSVVAGEDVTLSWDSDHADSCAASGGWSGSRPTSGNESTGPLTDPQSYTLDCTGPGGTASAAVAVAIRPSLDLSATPTTVAAGAESTLTWNARNATTCTASGGWSGDKALSGSELSGAIEATTVFGLSCSGPGGSVSESVSVGLTVPEPTVSLSAADTVVDSGATTTLSWTSTDATGCNASGGWSGARPVAGSESVGPFSTAASFTLTCSNTSGNAVAMVSVGVNGNLTLSWVAPTENVDGTTLTDLAGYRIYWGATSRSYDDHVQLNDPTATTHTVQLPAGEYYVAMTALDQQGNESAYSNEVLKTTQ